MVVDRATGRDPSALHSAVLMPRVQARAGGAGAQRGPGPVGPGPVGPAPVPTAVGSHLDVTSHTHATLLSLPAKLCLSQCELRFVTKTDVTDPAGAVLRAVQHRRGQPAGAAGPLRAADAAPRPPCPPPGLRPAALPRRGPRPGRQRPDHRRHQEGHLSGPRTYLSRRWLHPGRLRSDLPHAPSPGLVPPSPALCPCPLALPTLMTPDAVPPPLVETWSRQVSGLSRLPGGFTSG